MAMRKVYLPVILALLLVLGGAFPASAGSLSVQSMSAPENLVDTLMGSGITYSNVTFSGAQGVGGENGPVYSAGTFSGGTDIIGFENGVVLSSGDIQNVVGPNSVNNKSCRNGLNGDADLDALIPGYTTQDATVLEFDFVPQGNTVTFQYVFSSEEYNEYVGSDYNDVFGFFVNGYNIALVPGSNDRVSVNNINLNKNPQYYINNETGENGANLNTEMDGLTTVLTAQAQVNAGVTNHIKLAIADAGDEDYDSNVFIKAGSFSSPPPPQLQFSDAEYTVDENGGSATITVNRSGSSDSEVGVNYSTSDGTASAGSDYSVASGTLTFSAGETSKTFTVPVTDDSLMDGNETVRLALSDPTGGAVLGAQKRATLTIVDNDAPVLQFSAANYTVNEDVYGGLATISITRSGDSDSVVEVTYSTSDGTAVAGSDYTAVSGTLTFNAGETSKDFIIPVIDDELAEGNETVILALSNFTWGAVPGTRSTAVLTIIDNESLGNVDTGSPAWPEEGALGKPAVTSSSVALTWPPAGDGTAVDGYRIYQNGQLIATVSGATYTYNVTGLSPGTNYTFDVEAVDAAGNTSSKLSLTVRTDSSGGGGGGGGGGSSNHGQLKFGSETYTANENGNSVEITVKRTGGSDGVVTVDYATVNGSATAGTDYTASSGKLSFASGETGKTFSIPVIDDTAVEGNETVNLTLSNPTGGAVLGTPRTAVLSINDNDSAPSTGGGFTPATGGGSSPAVNKLIIKLTVGELIAIVNDQPYSLDAAPFINSRVNRTLIPIRFVSEALGAKVDWLARTKQLVVTDGQTRIVLTIGSKIALVNDQQITLDCAPVVISPGRTFVPLRFVSETLGARVDYEEGTGRITITR